MSGELLIKICGLTNLADARLALECGADYLGFVLYAKSPRAIDAAALARLTADLPEGVRTVGVFVNAPRDAVLAVARDCRLYAVQIHGDEAAADFRDMPLPVWRAVRLEAAAAIPSPSAWPAERYVLDSAPRGQYGGSGVAGDWSAAARFAADHPAMLAGGLTPENVAAAVRQVPALGVDVASGVEQRPGRKDPAKVRAFIENARGARSARAAE